MYEVLKGRGCSSFQDVIGGERCISLCSISCLYHHSMHDRPAIGLLKFEL